MKIIQKFFGNIVRKKLLFIFIGEEIPHYIISVAFSHPKY